MSELKPRVYAKTPMSELPGGCEQCKMGIRYGCVGDVKCKILQEYFTGNVQPPYKKRPDECPLVMIRAHSENQRFIDCHIWEPGDRLETISDKCEVLIAAEDIKALIAQDANDPLTLEQLEQMDGQPVWCEYINLQGEHRDGKWCICHTIYGDIQPMDGYAEGGTDTAMICYGKTWVAYRRPPERSKNDGC